MGARLRIGILGTGRIARVLAAASASHVNVMVWGRNGEALAALTNTNPSLRAASFDEAAEADLVALAVPPQAYREMLQRLAPLLPAQAIVVSLTNGVALDEIGGLVVNPVVKVIPTIAQSVSRGVTLIVAGPRASAEHVARVTGWLACFSAPQRVEESDIRVASNAAGSAVALMAAFASAFAQANAARAIHLTQAELERMTAETLGAVGDLARAGVPLDAMVETTATPGGVTEAALDVLRSVAPDLCRLMVEASFARQNELQALK